MAPQYGDESRGEDTPTTRTLRDRKSGINYNDEIDTDFGILRGNTGIPDEKFGPDEERIIIDDDPYDLDEAIFALENEDDKESSKSTPRIITHIRNPTKPTKSAIDFIEESVRNAKRNEAAKKAEDIIIMSEKKIHDKDLVVEELMSVLEDKINKNPSYGTPNVKKEDDDKSISSIKEERVGSVIDEFEKSLIKLPDKRSMDLEPEVTTRVEDGNQSSTAITSEPEIKDNQTSEEMQYLGTAEDNFGSQERREETTDNPIDLGLEEKATNDPNESLNTWDIFTSTSFNDESQSTLQPVVIFERSEYR